MCRKGLQQNSYTMYDENAFEVAMRHHLIYGTESCRFFVPSPCSATLGAHLSTLKEGTNGMAWQAEGGERASERKGERDREDRQK